MVSTSINLHVDFITVAVEEPNSGISLSHIF